MASDDRPFDKETVRPTTPEPRRSIPTRQESRDKLSPPAPDEDYIGATLEGRYRVLSKLGQGGMGVVYLAEHVKIEKKVAVKVLSGDFARKPDLVARFAQEARAASRIGHENIIDITDFGETRSRSAYFVMEFLEGRDLGRHVRESAPMPIARVVRIFAQMCRALSAAHAKGIIHRDLKPENIFLVDGREQVDFVKVLDFGLARVSVMNESERLTQTGMIFGTAEYMSPEQARGETADHRTDVYAAGCILYEMLTGDVPFHAQSFMAILRRQIEDEPDPPSRRAPSFVTPALDAVVLKALAKDRNTRYANMKELALALAQAAGVETKTAWSPQEDAPPLPLRPTPREPSAAPPAQRASDPSRGTSEPPRQRAGALIGIALAAIAIIGGITWQLWPPTVEKPPASPMPPVVTAPIVAPPAATSPRPSKISIVSTPSGADVMNGNERLGHTPAELSLPQGTTPFDVTVVLKGFKDQTLHIAPDHDREYVVQLNAAPTKPAHPTAPKPKPPAAPAPPPAQPTQHKGPAELKDVLSD